MKFTAFAALIGILFGINGAALAAPQNNKLASLLNQANQINNEEEDMAKELKSKAGDNQALVTMAETIKGDHQANQDALEKLASEKNITLDSYKENKAADNRLDQLNGAAFNSAFLNMQVRDHEKALSLFRHEKGSFSNDPEVQVYIEQTIPVLEAHLKMAQNLRSDDQRLGSHENPANNKNSD